MIKTKVSRSFRRQLKKELTGLQSEQIISKDQHETISLHYRLNDLAAESNSILIMAVYIIGAGLIGIGVISFVAAHWNAITPSLKVTMLITAMLTAHGSGFYLWQYSHKFPKLGHALVILGTLIFGASIGLFAQIFHIRGQWNGMFLPWALGAMAIAYTTASTPNAVIAIITSFFWFCGGFDLGSEIARWYPLAVLIGFLPYCMLRKSVLMLSLTLPAIGFGILFTATMHHGNQETYAMIVGMLVIGMAFYAGGLFTQQTERFASILEPATRWGQLATLGTLYICSFMETIDEVNWIKNNVAIHSLSGPFLITLGIFTSAGIIMTIGVLAQKRFSTPRKVILILLLLSMVVFLLFPYTTMPKVSIIVFSNIVFMAIAVCLIWQSFLEENRGSFWTGILLVAALIIGRTLEYETDLLVKSGVFIACGILVLGMGISFERFLKKRRLAHD